MKQTRIFNFFLPLLTLSVFNTTYADDVKIIAADFQSSNGNFWTVNVTLQHDDKGWDHYADRWQIVDSESRVLGNRVLHHPHVHEQPFTRGIGSIMLPEGVTSVFIEAHDKLHGWSPHRLMIDMKKAKGGQLRVEAGEKSHPYK